MVSAGGEHDGEPVEQARDDLPVLASLHVHRAVAIGSLDVWRRRPHLR